jgi:hypothetical protein
MKYLFVHMWKKKIRLYKPFIFSVLIMGMIIPLLLLQYILRNRAVFFSQSVENLINFDDFSRIYNRKVPNASRDSRKLNKIRNEMKFAWSKYKKLCWGKGELQPISRKCFTEVTGLTMVDSLSTLWIMGLHREFNKSRDYIRDSFKLEGIWSTFEIIIRFLGGYLSAYELSNDKVFLDKAVELGNALYPLINLTDGSIFATAALEYNDGMLVVKGFDYDSSLAERASFQLEFLTLYYLTKDEKFFNASFAFYKKLWKQTPDFALLSGPDPKNKYAKSVTFAGGSDSYYEYIIKTYLLTGQKSETLLKRHVMMVDEIKKTCVFHSKSFNLTTVGRRDRNRIDRTIEHLATFLAGMIAIGSVKDNEKAAEDLNFSAVLVDSYYRLYRSFKAGIAPESFHLTEESHSIIVMDSQYHLRPETVESIYIQWKHTGDPIYRTYAWNIFRSIKKYCRTFNGYVGIYDVERPSAWKVDKQESYFLSETLKYLYLTFESSHFLSHDNWVFNTEAHPLKIWDDRFVSENADKIDKMFV